MHSLQTIKRINLEGDMLRPAKKLRPEYEATGHMPGHGIRGQNAGELFPNVLVYYPNSILQWRVESPSGEMLAASSSAEGVVEKFRSNRRAGAAPEARCAERHTKQAEWYLRKARQAEAAAMLAKQGVGAETMAAARRIMEGKVNG